MPKWIDTRFVTMLACCGIGAASLPVSAYAQDTQQEYAPVVLNLGAGMEQLNYRERIELSGQSGPLELETDYQTEQLTHYSALNMRFSEGFALRFQGAGTLWPESSTEAWEETQQGFGVIQRNMMKIQRFELGLFGMIGERHRFLLGGKMGQTFFERTDFRETANSDAFESAWGKTLGITEETQSLWITEEVWAFSFALGYEVSNVFVEPGSGWRGFVHVMASTPFYYQLSNDGRQVTGSFNGYDVNAALGLGWQFNDHVALLGSLQGFYQKREEDEADNGDRLPENELWGAAPALNLVMAF